VNISLSLVFAGLASFLYLYLFRVGKPDPGATKLLKTLANPKTLDDDEEEAEDDITKDSKNIDVDSVTPSKGDSSISVRTPLTSNTTPAKQWTKNKPIEKDEEEGSKSKLSDIHKKIEQIDKRGKALFKQKKYMEAAEVFTEALNVISTSSLTDAESTGSLNRQVVTLTNNRSAMYEKSDLPDLALHDCDLILDLDSTHTKARMRKLRILESLERYDKALLEVCALQLKFMQDNREKLRMGIPVTPPVPQSKIEQLMAHIVPDEVEKQLAKIKEKYGESERALPSNHTILQLLQSFSGYNGWMAAAARDGNLASLTSKLDQLENNTEIDTVEKEVEKVKLLLKRGRRNAYHRKFDACQVDMENALAILEAGELTKEELQSTDTYARILEWVGMCRHLRYDLDGAMKCYEACADLEPLNAGILVKRAGVKMDAGDQNEALALFDTALGLDARATDALLHRANLRMLQQKPMEAKDDLMKCLEIRPDHVLARLRLATVLMATEDMSGASKCLMEAEKSDPKSSEVHSYRGEMHFANGEFTDARAEFDHAIDLDSTNPTPYVNAALAVMNVPPVGGGPPDIPEAIRLLEKAIEVDPQFHQAYVHLGQLKLSMATDLSTAKEVVSLYDKGLTYCRTAEELKDIVSMRILTVAQVDAASMLKMDSLQMQ